MRPCCCSMAGTEACARCGNRVLNFPPSMPSPAPWQYPLPGTPVPLSSPPVAIDYEKLATMIADKLKEKA